MHCFINLCRCCLISDVSPTTADEYLCKNEQFLFNTTNYYDLILDIYPDLQLERTLPFNLCNDCQRLLQEATKLKQYLDNQMEDKHSQQLLMTESMCSGCTQFSSSLFDKIDILYSFEVSNMPLVDILKKALSHYQFQSHISYKYCQSCSNYVKSVYLLKELLSQNNGLYEKYCSTLIGYSEQVMFSTLLIALETKAVNGYNSTETMFEKIFIKEEISMDSDPIEIKYENNYELSNKLSNDTTTTEEKQYKYNIGQKQITTDSQLKIHTQIHTVQKPYKCNTCQKTFNGNNTLNKHKRIHTGEKPYKCTLCPKTFSANSDLIKHKRIHSGEKPYKCNTCQKTFSRSDTLNKHKLIHSGEKQCKCYMCPKAFSTGHDLKIHIRRHTGEKPYKCNTCQQAFTTTGELIGHQRIHTEEKPYECNICAKQFTINSNLVKHKRIHTGEKPHKCNLCQKTFSRSSVLIKHKRIHTGEKPYKCDTCQKAFSRSDTLTKHQRIHIREKPLLEMLVPSVSLEKERKKKEVLLVESNNCNSIETNKAIKEEIHLDSNEVEIKFVNDYELSNNLSNNKSPIGEKQYICNICLKGFTTRSNLKIHNRTHTGEKPYKCNVCQKTFSANNDLNKHKRIHTGEKPYKCNMCPKAFALDGNLKMHKRIHSGEKPFKCNICAKTFTRQFNVKLHQRIHIREKPLLEMLVPSVSPEKERKKEEVLLVESNNFNSIETNKAIKEEIHLDSNEVEIKFVNDYEFSNTLSNNKSPIGEKQYICNICLKGFTTRSNLKIHNRTHTGEKPYKCNVCQKTFSANNDLNKHKRIHTGEKPYKCNMCPKAFALDGNLKMHKRIHSGEKPFKCNICAKTFTRQFNVKLHQRIHTGEKSLLE